MGEKGKGSPAGRLVELDQAGADPEGRVMTNPIVCSHVLAIMFVHRAPPGAVRHRMQLK